MDIDSTVFTQNWIVYPNAYLKFIQDAINQSFVLSLFWTETDITEG